MAQKTAEQELDEVRLAVGANEGEPLLDAIHRYTFAVQLGCALKLEQQSCITSEETMPISVVWRAAIKTLRDDIPAATYGDNAQPDAVERWRTEQLQALRDRMVEQVLPRWWEKFMGGLPSDVARAELCQMLLDFEPGQESPKRFNPEGMVIPAATLREDP